MSAGARRRDAPEALADFLRELRHGVEGGMDPLAAAEAPPPALPDRLRAALEALGRRTRGEYREDEWGFDEDFAEAVYPVFEFLYDVWWRVETTGVRNVPAHGRALLVSNHAGSIFPFDASMILGAIMKEHPLPRWAAVHGPRLGLRAAVPVRRSCGASAASRRARTTRRGCSSRTSW